MNKVAFVKYTCSDCGDFMVIHETPSPNGSCGFCDLPVTYRIVAVFYYVGGTWQAQVGNDDELMEMWKGFEEIIV